MRDVLESIISNVLYALYQPFWFALLCTVLFMFTYLYCYDCSDGGKGIRSAVIGLIRRIKNIESYRILFFLSFYTLMILFRTLINRNLWLNPLSEVLGSWWIYEMDDSTGELVLTTECIENIMLFVPFTFLYLMYKSIKKLIMIQFVDILLFCATRVFCFSLCIEFLQLFLRLGSFQLSDLFYNTFGGILGGMLFYIYSKIHSLHS